MRGSKAMSEQASLKSKSKINRLRLVVILCKPIGVKKRLQGTLKVSFTGTSKFDSPFPDSSCTPAAEARLLEGPD